MSNKEFFGRLITGGINAEFQFDLCEICQRKSPNWLEVQYQEGLPVFRVTCHECHDNYVNKSQEYNENLKEFDPNEEIQEVVRPGWVDDFLSESRSNLETIETVTAIESNPDDQEINEDQFSEPPESFLELTEQPEIVTGYSPQLASWAPKFIEQALFGANPEGWLAEQGGYEPEQFDSTLMTLGNFASNEITSVKLSAIQCLLGLYNRDKKQKDRVIQQLSNFQIDSDLTVSEFASQTIQQIK